jgi:signal transduction histidine kinase
VIWIIGQATIQEWAMLTVGTIFITLILIGLVVYFIWTVREYRLNRRQANFLDSVTHELKSPIASIKLCLQTLDMRDVSPEQQREFHRFMMEDIQRLDSLIDHLLAVARLDQVVRPEQIEDVPLDPLLRKCADEIVRRYQLEPAQVRLEVAPVAVRGTPRDLDVVFLNLLDNAVKYGGAPPEVVVQAECVSPDRVAVRISDNGGGVRFELRRKVFQRFYRGGSELERTTKGTGLGLHIVKSLVARMKGKVHVHGRGPLRGATFEVELPGGTLPETMPVATDQGTNAPRSPAQTPDREPVVPSSA